MAPTTRSQVAAAEGSQHMEPAISHSPTLKDPRRWHSSARPQGIRKPALRLKVGWNVPIEQKQPHISIKLKMGPRPLKEADKITRRTLQDIMVDRKLVKDQIPSKLLIPRVGAPCKDTGSSWHKDSEESVFLPSMVQYVNSEKEMVVRQRHRPTTPLATRWNVKDAAMKWDIGKSLERSTASQATFVQPADMTPLNVENYSGEYEMTTAKARPRSNKEHKTRLTICAQEYYDFHLLGEPSYRYPKSLVQLRHDTDHCKGCALSETGKQDLEDLVASKGYDPRKEFPSCFRRDEDENNLDPFDISKSHKIDALSMESISDAQAHTWCQKLKSDLHLEIHANWDSSFEKHFCSSEESFVGWSQWHVHATRHARDVLVYVKDPCKDDEPGSAVSSE